ncbi:MULTISPECIES: GAF domain-containing sensor histidine kinase [unclassified Xanthomonas]|uniref:GAF domain-containing sensor histidine kinase n=1 Tax=unclassified Xanthomonas TaxID=2643310 RepID=UPI002A81F8B7|nr:MULTISPECIES: GAF domain-containing sensor histidine kinase [unclassified Xanthomonas]MDY4297210.1 GAF domain-containing sensor histidine kinase [Xanthomonas sp. LF02-5]MDY4358829.1 GAF domain-containing sensor histidine kinase [Xanthomonas sp. LF04-12]
MSPVEPAADPVYCAAKPRNEALRLDALHSYAILDTPREPAFDDITRLAGLICQAPIAVVNLIDSERQWFKSEIGLGTRETPLATSLCAHALLEDDLLLVPDTREDPRFACNPLVTGEMRLHFYAGALLKTSDGLALGTVCVLDRRPRQLSYEQIEALRALARQAMGQLELRKALHLAQESNHYRSRLMAIAGHDLKTPLRTASYALSKLQRQQDAAQDGALETARTALNQVASGLDQLATNAAAGELRLPALQTLALADVLAPILATWQPQAAAKDVQLRSVPTSLRVRSSAALLSTLLGNLLGNAVKYTAQGKVLIGCRRRGDQVAVEIIDRGIGMDEEGLRTLFQAFRQADPRSDGLGLGLWIVRRAAETLGCTVEVRSQPGHGSRFTVLLPAASTDA